MKAKPSNRLLFVLRRFFTAQVVMISYLGMAHAANLYWDGGTTDVAGAGNGISAGGAGTWNTTIKNWDDATTHVAWNLTTPDNATFGGVGATVTLGTNITAGIVNISGPAYTITGNTLTLDSINIAAGTNATITSTVAGRTSNTAAINGGVGSVLSWNGGSSIATLNLNTGVVRNGTVANSASVNVAVGGLLEWNTTNPTPTAGNAVNLTLNSGVFRTTGGLTHGHLGNVTFNGGVMDFTAGSYNNESLQLNGNVTAGTGTFTGTSWLLQTSGDNTTRGLSLKGNRTFTVNAGNELRAQGELENPDTNDGALTKAGTGKLVLLNTSSYSAGSTVNAGTLQLGDISAAGTGTGTAIANGINGGVGTITINAGGTLAASHAIGTSVTYLSNLLAGAGTLQVIGAGHFGLSGTSNTFTGTVDMKSSGQLYGGLTLDYTSQNNNKLGTTASLNLAGGNLRVLGSSAGATSQTVGAINIANGASLITLTPGTSQNVGLTATSFTQSGKGSVTLRSAGTLGTTANLNVGAATLGRWATTQNTSEQNTAFLTKDGSNNAVALQFTGSTGTSTESAGVATLASQGTSSVYLNNANQTITANLTIDSIATQNDLMLNNAAVLTLGGGGLVMRNAGHWIQTSAGTRGAITSGLPSGELYVTSGMSEATDFQIRTDVVDNGAVPTILVKGGTGQLILGGGGTSSYTGGTYVNSGRLQLTNVGALGTGAVTVRPGGQLWLNVGTGTFARNMTLAGLGSADGSANNYGALRINSSPTISGNVTVNDHARITLDTGGANPTFSGIIAGTGDIELRNLASMAYGVVTNASNTFSGRWIVRDGNAVVRFASDAAVGAVPTNFRDDAIVLDGGRMQFGSTSAGASFTLNANRGISVPNAGTTGYLQVWGGMTMTIAGAVSGPGTLELGDTGTAVFTGVSPMTGNLRNGNTSGTLTLNSGGSFTQLSQLQLMGTMNINAGSSILVRDLMRTSDGSGGTTTLNQTGGDLSVIGTTIQDERNNAVVIAHWGATTTYNQSGGTFNVPNAPVMFGWDGSAVWNISGSAVANVYGIMGSARNNSGTINLTGGRLNIGAYGVPSLGSNKLIKLGAGTVGALADWSSSLNNFRLSSATTGVTFDPSGKTITLTGVLADDTAVAGKLNLNGFGTLVLGGANTFTGGSTINNGTLQLNNAAGLGVNTNNLTVNGGALNLNTNSVTIGNLSGTGGTITDNSSGAGATTLTVGQGSNATFAGAITNGASKSLALTKNGTGTLTLSGANTYGGATAVNAGSLAVSGSLGATSAAVANGATLAFTGAGTTTGSITLASGAVLDTSGRASALTLGSGQTLIAGRATSPANDVVGDLATSAGAVLNVMSGVGTAGTLTTSGNLTLGGGTVDLDLSNVVGSGNDTISLGGALHIAGPTTVAINRVSGSLANGSYVLVQGTGPVTGSVGDLTPTGLISGATRQTFTLSTGTVANALTLDVTGQAANLDWNNAAATGIWSTNVVDENWNNLTAPDAQDRYYDGDNIVFPDIIGQSTQTVALDGTLTPATVTVNNTVAGTSYLLNGTGKITGATGLTKSGSGLLILSNTGGNDYTGATTVNAGTLRIGDAAAVSQASAITLASGAVMDVNGLNVTVPSVGGVGTVHSESGAGTLTASTAGSSTISALLADGAGGLSLVKSGAGTVSLTNSNTYTGSTTVSAGTLQIGNGGTSGTLGTAAVTNDAILAVNRSDVFTLANDESGTGSFVQAGTGTTAIAGVLSHTGGTTISAGTLQIGTGGLTGSIDGPITDNSLLVFDRSDLLSVASVISGTGGISQIGTGTTNLDGANTFTGGVSISAGVLSIVAANGLGSGSGAVNLTNGGTLEAASTLTIGRGINVGTGGGKVDVDAGKVLARNGGFTGGNTLTKVDDGTLRFQSYGGGAFAGSLAINAGTAEFAGGVFNGNIGLSAINVASGATLKIVTGAAHALGGYLATTPTLNINGGTFSIGQEQYLGTVNITGGSIVSGGGNPEVRVDSTWAFNVLASNDSSTVGANVIMRNVNSALSFNVADGGAADDLIWNGNLNGNSASVTKTGAGVMRMDSTTTFGSSTVGMVINGGTVKAPVINDTNSSIGIGFLALNTGTLNYTGTSAATTSRIVWVDQGDGTINIADAGASLTLTGAVNGNATLNTRTLTKSGSGTLVLANSNAFTDTVHVTTGSLQIGAGGTAGNVTGNITDDAALVFNRSDALSYAGVISGGGTVTKNGAGTLTLSGTHTYTGVTTVNAGDLHLTGSLAGSATVNATLSGNGTVTGATTVTTGGKLTPGSAGVLGDLHFGGNVTLDSGSNYEVDITGATTNDKIVVAGTLAAGGTITLTATGHTLVAGDSFDIADAATITGTPTISPATPGTGLLWDTSAFNTTGVIKVKVADPYLDWSSQITNGLTLRTDDADGDGFSNLQEYLFGTLPMVNDGALTTSEVVGGDLIIRWKQRAGASYQLMQSSTLGNDWAPATGATITDDGAESGGYQPKKATITLGAGKLFFRVEGVDNNG